MNASIHIPVASDEADATLGKLLRGSATSWPGEDEWVALVQAIATGDQFAFRDLYARMHSLVFTLIMRIVRDLQTSEELTIDVFHGIWTRAASYRQSGGSVVGWVMNQARSRAIDQTRFERRQKRVNPFPDNPESEQQSPTADALFDSELRGLQVRRAVAQLTEYERTAIEMAYFSDCTYAEVADRLHEPPGTVKTRIRSGLAKLRVSLAAEEHS